MTIKYLDSKRIVKLSTDNTVTTSLPLTGLKAYYKFDEVSGDIINQAGTVGSSVSLGSNADGQNSGADYGATGILGTAITFVDGTSDIVTLGTSKSQFNFMWSTTMKFTLVFWYKSTALPTGQTDIFTSLDSDHNNKGMGCQFRANRALNVQIGNVAVSFTTANNFLPNDISNFHMVVVTGDYQASPQITISVDNGTPVTQALTGSLSDADSTNVQTIGSSAGSYPLEMDGSIDEMSIWNRVLTADEISAIYNGGLGVAIDDAKSSFVSKPTNVQDNSILVEKDTANRYWFDAESETESTGTFSWDGKVTSADNNNQGFYVANTSSVVYGKKIESVSFWLKKVGSPTGTAYCRVWGNSGSGTTVTQVHEFGSINSSTLASSYTKYTFDTGSYTLAVGDTVGIAFTGSSASTDLVGQLGNLSVGFDSGNTYRGRKTTSTWSPVSAHNIKFEVIYPTWIEET